MITKKEIKKISSLAKINIPDDELDSYSEQISKILDYMSTLNEVDTSKVEEFSNALFNSEQLMREDEVEPSLNRDDILDIAPDSDGVYFKVPKVIKEDD
tara:strand:- start:1016 stop:1312 length:297 start_codon:yes stop_codon:yes gene_type:complete